MDKKYVDFDTMLRKIENLLFYENDCGEDFNLGYDKAIFDVLDILADMPTADVQEVKHGRWITSEIATDSGCTSCSCCCSEYYIGDLQNLEGDNDFVMYCPNCGARMDGDEGGNL